MNAKILKFPMELEYAAEAEVKRGQTTAIITGAVAVLLGVGYLFLVQILDSRGVILVPPPPEAFDPWCSFSSSHWFNIHWLNLSVFIISQRFEVHVRLLLLSYVEINSDNNVTLYELKTRVNLRKGQHFHFESGKLPHALKQQLKRR